MAISFSHKQSAAVASLPRNEKLNDLIVRLLISRFLIKATSARKVVANFALCRVIMERLIRCYIIQTGKGAFHHFAKSNAPQVIAGR